MNGFEENPTFIEQLIDGVGLLAVLGSEFEKHTEVWSHEGVCVS